MKLKSPIEIRLAVPEDINRIMVLENECFLAPWAMEALDYQIANTTALFLVAQSGNEIVGFVLSWVVDIEVHLLKLAVDPDRRRQGIAALLLEETAQRAEKRGGIKIFLEVRRQNIPAILFYKKNGFLPVGVRKGYYQDNGEDAIVMSRETS